jgi:hypothetical protein
MKLLAAHFSGPQPFDCAREPLWFNAIQTRDRYTGENI